MTLRRLPAHLREWPVPGVARVEKRGLEESGGEDHHVVRFRIVSLEAPGGHLPPVGRARLSSSSIIDLQSFLKGCCCSPNPLVSFLGIADSCLWDVVSVSPRLSYL